MVRNRVLILGTGHLGKWALAALRAGIEPLAFCDNNSWLWGSENRRHSGDSGGGGHDALWRLDCGGGGDLQFHCAAEPTARTRLQAGGTVSVTVLEVLAVHAAEDRLELPHRIMARAAEMAAGYDLLADDQSRREFFAQIRWRCLWTTPACRSLTIRARCIFRPACCGSYRTKYSWTAERLTATAFGVFSYGRATDSATFMHGKRMRRICVR